MVRSKSRFLLSNPLLWATLVLVLLLGWIAMQRIEGFAEHATTQQPAKPANYENTLYDMMWDNQTKIKSLIRELTTLAGQYNSGNASKKSEITTKTLPDLLKKYNFESEMYSKLKEMTRLYTINANRFKEEDKLYNDIGKGIDLVDTINRMRPSTPMAK